MINPAESGSTVQKPCLQAKRGVAALMLALLLAAPVKADDIRLFRIGTGGFTGVYHPIGKMIATGITPDPSASPGDQPGENGVPGYIGVAQSSAGSVDNVIDVTAGAIEGGLVQADVAAWALKAEGVFAGNTSVRSLRAVASLYPEKFQIVTRRDAHIKTVEDLRGRRISVDEVGSGTLAVMRIVLEAHGLSENDLRPVYLKPAFTQEKIINGDLQGFVMMAGVPMAAVSQLSHVGISFVPIDPEVALRIGRRYPYLVPSRIPAGVYPGIPEVPTIEVYALLVVDAGMEESLVFDVAAALWSPRSLDLLKKGHVQGRAISAETALRGVSIPLHPGAEKYYRQHADRFRYADRQ